MNDNAETVDQETTQPGGTGAGQECGASLSGPNGPGSESPGGARVVTVPPPPSAPSEFLGAQWLGDGRNARIRKGSDRTPTPPPPSATSEFLLGQWRDGERPDAESDGTDMEALLLAAAPSSIDSADQLLSLGQDGSDCSLPSSPFEERTDGDDDAATPDRIRGVPLTLGEKITKIFLPDRGLVESVPEAGQALILTDRRLIAFRGLEGFRDTHLAMASEITQCSVRTGQRNWGAVIQGLMIMIGGAVLYLIVGYWLAGEVSGPNVPVLNIDVAPLIALVVILIGIIMLAQNYFARPAGAVIFHGEGLEFAFPFRSSLDVQQVYDFVDAAQSVRNQAGVNYPGDRR